MCERNKYIRFHVPSETRQQVKIQFKCNNKRKDEAGNVHLQGARSANSASFSASDENLKAETARRSATVTHPGGGSATGMRRTGPANMKAERMEVFEE